MARRGRVVLIVVVAVVTMLVDGFPPAGAAQDNHRIGEFRVRLKLLTLVDTSRATPANGSYPGSPERTLPTLLFLPERSTGDEQQFPLVVFSPGYASIPEDYESLLEQWASAGYVVAAVQFPLSSEYAPGGTTLSDVVNQPGDVRFVIEKLISLNQTRGNPVTNLIDTSRVGVAGHSLGGVTTLALTANTCCRSQGALIRAAVVLSSYAYQFEGSGTYFPTDGYHPPTLEVSGTADTTSPLFDTESTYLRTLSPKYQALMLGAPHVDFGKPWGPVIDRTVVAFLNAYLAGTGSRGSILKAANVPGVSKGRFN
jgi:predicted dienelactone hydrolase